VEAEEVYKELIKLKKEEIAGPRCFSSELDPDRSHTPLSRSTLLNNESVNQT
jgi:hypothetical protein